MSTALTLAAERPWLHLTRDGAIAAAIDSLDAKLGPRAEVTEHPAVTVFSIVAGGDTMTANIPTRALTPRVRGKLYDLMRAVEDELR